MDLYKRPEMETDPAKLPGQIVNPIPNSMLSMSGAKTIADIVRRIEREEEYSPHATVNS